MTVMTAEVKQHCSNRTNRHPWEPATRESTPGKRPRQCHALMTQMERKREELSASWEVTQHS